MRLLGDDVAGRVGLDLDPAYLVAGTLVVDEGAGPELADREEPRPLHVIAVAARAAGTGNVGGDRQARE